MRINALHAIDHLVRLLGRLDIPTATQAALAQPTLAAAATRCRAVLALARSGLQGTASADWLAKLETQALELAELRRGQRLTILGQTAAGIHTPAEALAALDAVRWLERVTNHTWRACHHLAQGDAAPARESVEAPTPLEE